MAADEEAGTGGKDGEGQESRVDARELTSQGKDPEQGHHCRHDGRERRVAAGDVAREQGRHGDAPEEQGWLVEVRLVPRSGGQPESMTKRVLRQQGLARLV